MTPHWSIRRRAVPKPLAARRWDRAYQRLLRGHPIQTPEPLPVPTPPSTQEGTHEGRRLCPRLYTAADADPDR
jgi:hypothetical protein